MAHSWQVREHPDETFSAADLVTLQSEPVPEKTVWRLDRITFEGDKTTSGGNTRARLVIIRGSTKRAIFEQDGPSADTLYRDPDPIELAAGERLGLEWDEAQAATRLQLNLYGRAFSVAPDG